MSNRERMGRRKAVGIIAASQAGALLGAPGSAAGPPPDQPRDLQPTGSDTGTLYPTLDRLAARNNFALSFLGDRFRSVDEYRRQGRDLLINYFYRR